MPHVDDGTLHALLDGALHAEEPGRVASVEAHLAACPDCRARLDAAAVDRNRASEILGVLGSDPRPDFQEVLTRAGAGPRPGTPRAGHGGRTRAMAWAATIVVALGTGYLVRDQLVPDPPAIVADSRPVAESETRPAPPGAATDAPAAEPGPRRPAAPGSGPDRQPEPAREPAREPPTTAPAPPLGAPTSAPATTPPPAPAAPTMAEAEMVPRSPVVATSGREGRSEAATRAAALLAEDRATAGAPGVPAVAQAGEVSRLTPLDVVYVDERIIALEDAVELMEGSLYRLPDAEIIEVLALGSSGQPEVRTLQRLPGGAEVLVDQRRAPDAETYMAEGARPGAERATAVGAAAAPETVRVLRAGYWLTLRGTLPPAALEALASAAEPVPSP